MNVSGWLTIVQGPPMDGSFHIRQDVLTIGRAPTNPVQIVDPSISRRHALLRRINGVFQVTDLKSRNGTWINGERIQTQTQLKNNDLLQLGDVVLKFVVNPGYKEKDLVLERKDATRQSRIMETVIHEMDPDSTTGNGPDSGFTKN